MPARLTDNGTRFRLTASNPFATIASSSATLSVRASASIGITILPTGSPLTVAPGATQTFTATVTGTMDQTVLWSLGGSALGTLSASGVYQAPADRVGTIEPVVIRASSAADPNVSASVTIALTPSAAAAFTRSGDPVRDLAVVGELFEIASGVRSLAPETPIASFKIAGPGVGRGTLKVARTLCGSASTP